jgi:hypothetical protein
MTDGNWRLGMFIEATRSRISAFGKTALSTSGLSWAA